MRRVNLLVLDEPTNHLDLEAVEQLELALARFTGSLVLVSHDRRFLEGIAPDRELALPLQSPGATSATAMSDRGPAAGLPPLQP